MKWLKRTVLSIVRRPAKSLLLLLSVFVMGNLLAGSLAIIMTSKNVKSEIKKGLGAEALITGNFSEVDVDFDAKIALSDQYEQVMDQICEDERVEICEYHYESSGVGFTGNKTSYFRIYGTNEVESSYIKEGKHKISKEYGSRNFTAEELINGERVVLVDYSLGFVRDEMGNTISTGFTKPGNKITLSIHLFVDGQEDITYPFEVTVIGSYLNAVNSNSGTMIYMPNKLLKELVIEAKEYADAQNLREVSNPDFDVDFAGIKLKDNNYLESFDADAKALIASLPSNFEYTSSGDDYERSAGPVENLDTIAQVIFVASILATILILGLVILFFISERKKEIGIYVSLGEKKKNIVLQIAAEILLVSTIAVSLAGISGIFVGNKLSNYMLEVQRYVRRQQDLGKLANIPAIYKPVKNGMTTYSRDDIIDNYRLEVGKEYFAILYAVGEMTVIVACIAPLAYMVRLKPKDNLI